MAQIPQVGDVFRHYKNKNFYLVRGTGINANNTGSGMPEVYYEALDNAGERTGKLYNRDLNEFVQFVQLNGELVERFQFHRVVRVADADLSRVIYLINAMVTLPLSEESKERSLRSVAELLNIGLHQQEESLI